MVTSNFPWLLEPTRLELGGGSRLKWTRPQVSFPHLSNTYIKAQTLSKHRRLKDTSKRVK